MNDCGDKLVTTQEPVVCGKSKKRKHGKPVASVKFGSAVVPIYQLASAGRKRFILSFYMEGKRERRSFTNLESAKKEAQLVAQRIQGGRQEMNDLRPHDREAYRTVVDLLMPSGVPLVTAVQEYVRANKLLNGLPLLTAVDEFSRKARGMKLGVKVKDVVEELLVAKKQDGLSHRYQLQLQSNLRRFAADFDVPISHIRRDQIDDWLRKRGVAIRSRNGLLATIRVLFSFAKKRAYLPVGDVTEAEALDKIRAADVDTEIFTPEQFAKILHAAPPSGFWDDRDARQKFMLHAEVNLCSLFRRGEAKLVATTTMPCTACMQTLCAYGIREIYYRDVYHASDAPEIAKLYGVKLERITDFPELDPLGGV